MSKHMTVTVDVPPVAIPPVTNPETGEIKYTKLLTKAKWRRMKEKERWWIYTALRGPDILGTKLHKREDLKLNTTAVIRFHVSDVINIPPRTATMRADNAVHFPFSWRPRIIGWRYVKGPTGYLHFIQHITSAAATLGLPVLYDLSDEFMPMSLPQKAQAELAENMKKGDTHV